ncbi:MAG: hypothetical protein JWN29_1654 [Acidimicrobiales bacterium]|nr:hypothetical protein [Acidimicrobiales bacterium]
MELVLQACVAWQTLKLSARERWSEEVGEGVISTAIAVLIMALIGFTMWTVFDRVFQDAGTRVEDKVSQIG